MTQPSFPGYLCWPFESAFQSEYTAVRHAPLAERFGLDGGLDIARLPVMRARVYVETTIPSFYHEIRAEPEMVARRAWTREWWDNQSCEYEVVISAAVIEELESGEHPRKQACLDLVSGLSLLPVEDEIGEIVDAYIRNHVMPEDPRGDALHLALASYHHCQFLLTWNCQHLANANKFEHIRHVNTLLGLFVPILATPLELISRKD